MKIEIINTDYAAEVRGGDEEMGGDGHPEVDVKFPLILPAGVVARRGGIMGDICGIEENDSIGPIHDSEGDQQGELDGFAAAHRGTIACVSSGFPTPVLIASPGQRKNPSQPPVVAISNPYETSPPPPRARCRHLVHPRWRNPTLQRQGPHRLERPTGILERQGRCHHRPDDRRESSQGKHLPDLGRGSRRFRTASEIQARSMPTARARALEIPACNTAARS